ncbi:MAG: hypothetical protein M8349_07860, partial [ANME-2 cluster archaeon]|nr:hypothetical protein [ANME-2 cluster archaeon]
VDLLVKDPLDNYVVIGYTKPVKFRVSTGTFIAVPPAGKPIVATKQDTVLFDTRKNIIFYLLLII